RDQDVRAVQPRRGRQPRARHDDGGAGSAAVNRATLVVAALAALATGARAGGLSRPNLISARGVGRGGAFTGIADDATAWYFNPAGAAWADDGVSVGVEIVYAPRSYVPIDASGTRGDAQKATAIAPVPAIGFVIHPSSDGVPSR